MNKYFEVHVLNGNWRFSKDFLLKEILCQSYSFWNKFFREHSAGLVNARPMRFYDFTLFIVLSFFTAGSPTQADYFLLALREPAVKRERTKNYVKPWNCIGLVNANNTIFACYKCYFLWQKFHCLCWLTLYNFGIWHHMLEKACQKTASAYAICDVLMHLVFFQ